MIIALATTHSSGINWDQAIATGITIIGSIYAGIVTLSRRMENSRSRSQNALGATIDKAVHDVTDAISGELHKISVSIDTMDRRLWRVESTIMTNDKDAREDRNNE